MTDVDFTTATPHQIAAVGPQEFVQIVTRMSDRDEWTVRFADGTCTTMPGHEGRASVSLTMSPVDFAKVVAKGGNPVNMFLTGRITATGDLGLATSITSFFDLPRP